MKLAKIERETIILFNEEENFAEVYTFNTSLKRKLRKSEKEYPQECLFEWENEWGAQKYRIPKSMVSIRLSCSETRKKKVREKALAAGRRPPVGKK